MININQKLLIKFYEENGLNPRNSMRIVEITAPSIENSFSYNAPSYNSFLVSKFITCSDLKKYRMLDMGVKGCLLNGSLFIAADEDNSHITSFEEKDIDGIIHKQLIVQSLDEFDIILSTNYSEELDELTKLPNQGEGYFLYIGFNAQNKDELKEYINFYSKLAKKLNYLGNKCEFIQKDTFGLIRKR